jgi:hypothetical protein
MLSTGAGHTAGKDLCTLGDELTELCNVLVIDGLYLVCTEDANLFTLLVGTKGTLGIVSIHFSFLLKISFTFSFAAFSVKESGSVI